MPVNNPDLPLKQHFIERRLKLIKHYNIDLLLDVGANVGRYALEMRNSGYRGGIVSFEPLSSAFTKLKEKAVNDTLWQVENFALGNRDGKTTINISANSVSSSILDMLPSVTAVAPQAAYTNREEIEITKLDAVFNRYYKPGNSVFLKIDTQGYEKEILKGAARSLKNIIGIQMETSLVPLYRGETLLDEMIGYMKKLGYRMMSIEPGFHNPGTGQLLQADLIFFKDDII